MFFRVLRVNSWPNLCTGFTVEEVTKDFISTVWEDGSISLKCKNNGLYLRGCGKYTDQDVACLVDHGGFDAEPCSELGVCDQCKFGVEVGTLERVDIEIIGIEFGEMNDEIPPTPDVATRDSEINLSDQEISATLKVRLVKIFSGHLDTHAVQCCSCFNYGHNMELSLEF